MESFKRHSDFNKRGDGTCHRSSKIRFVVSQITPIGLGGSEIHDQNAELNICNEQLNTRAENVLSLKRLDRSYLFDWVVFQHTVKSPTTATHKIATFKKPFPASNRNHG
jgi:hypothetical protein